METIKSFSNDLFWQPGAFSQIVGLNHEVGKVVVQEAIHNDNGEVLVECPDRVRHQVFVLLNSLLVSLRVIHAYFKLLFLSF